MGENLMDFSNVRIERASFAKLIKRIKFRFWRVKTDINIFFDIMQYKFSEHNDDEEELELDFGDEEAKEMWENLDRMESEHIASRPRIDPRYTVLFRSEGNQYCCNFITKRKYEKRICCLYVKAKLRGMTSYIVDTSTPFGLLAYEMLLKLKEIGEEFNLYIFQSKTFSKGKSFRLIRETDIERMLLWQYADYEYKIIHVDDIDYVALFSKCCGIAYTEKRTYISHRYIPADLFTI